MKNRIDTHLGKRMREKRRKMGMTLAEIATKIGVSHQQIQKYEQAHSRISANTLYRLCQLYGVPESYFFEGFRENPFNEELSENFDIVHNNVEKQFNILLVEDDPADELVMRRALDASQNNLDIFCVHDGVQALEFLRRESTDIQFGRPDLIFLDIGIPKRNGFEVLKEVKRDRRVNDIPIIMTTNSINVKELIFLYKNHASGFLRKSFEFNVFKEKVGVLLTYWKEVVILPNRAHQKDILS